MAAVESISALPSIDPFAALLVAVNLAGTRLGQLHVRVGDDVTSPLLGLEGEALDRLVRVSRAAIDSRVLERQQVLTERAGLAIAAAAEEALAEVSLTRDQRVRFAKCFEQRIEQLERCVPDES